MQRQPRAKHRFGGNRSINFELRDELGSRRAFRVMRPRMQTMVQNRRLGFRADALWRRAPWANFWRLFFAGLIKTGLIEIETAGGHKFTLGDGSSTKLALRFNDKAAPAFVMLDPELNFDELYVDGRIEVTQGTIFDVLMPAAAYMWRPDGSLWVRLRKGAFRAAPAQPSERPLTREGQRRVPRRSRRHLLRDVPRFLAAPISNAPACRSIVSPDLSWPYSGLRNKAPPTRPATTAPETGASQKNQS